MQGVWHGLPSQATRRRQRQHRDHRQQHERRAERRRETRDSRDMERAKLHIHCGRVEFEKWHALGNDYVIVEASALPFELTPARIAAICAPHTGVGSDGILLLSEPDEPGYVARLRIFNPDGSEAELSGNGAREAVLYLRRRGWTQADTFSIQTAAGEIRPRITSDTECTVDMGQARPAGRRLPVGGTRRPRRADRGRAHLALSARPGRQPPVRDRGRRRANARGARAPRDRPRDRAPRAVSQPHQRVLVRGRAIRPRSARGSSSAASGRRPPAAPARPAPRSRTCSPADARR